MNTGSSPSAAAAAAAQLRDGILRLAETLKESAARVQTASAQPQDMESVRVPDGMVKAVIEYVNSDVPWARSVSKTVWARNSIGTKVEDEYIIFHTYDCQGGEPVLFMVPEESFISVEMEYPPGFFEQQNDD
jgi:hypothetical protein